MQRRGGARSKPRNTRMGSWATRAQPLNHIVGAQHTSPEQRICPACGLSVDCFGEKLRRHDVGTSRKNSWPCPGNEAAPRNTDER